MTNVNRSIIKCPHCWNEKPNTSYNRHMYDVARLDNWLATPQEVKDEYKRNGYRESAAMTEEMSYL